MISRKTILVLGILLVSVLFSQNNNANEGIITFKKGDVQILKSNGETLQVKEHMKVSIGDTILTKLNAAVEIQYGIEKKIRLAQNTTFKIGNILNQEKDESKFNFNLVSGKVWAKVEKLQKNSQFIIETPTVIAGVRGTIFVVNQMQDQSTELFVGRGAVAFLSKILNKEVVVKDNYAIQIDFSGKLSDARVMTEDDKKNMMSGIPVFFKGNNKGSSINIEDEINNEKMNKNLNKIGTDELRENDLTAGRSLRDKHGNKVRVEQVFRKKDSSSVQIINLTERKGGLHYIDSVVTFNAVLPNEFKDWGTFFINQNNLIVTKRDTLIGSKNKNQVNDLIRWIGLYNPKSDKYDEFITINDGVELKAPSANASETDFKEVFDQLLKNNNQLSGEGVIPLFNKTTGEYVGSLTIAIFVIDNNGNVLNKSYFDNNNVLDIFTSTAAEIIISSDKMMYGDIDLVIIPDIVFVMIQNFF